MRVEGKCLPVEDRIAQRGFSLARRVSMQYLFPDGKHRMTCIPVLASAILSLCQIAVAQQTAAIQQKIDVPLKVDAGTPLRLYITQRVSYRSGANVEAKFAEPVWAFDRIVIPAGTIAEGQVTQLKPVPGIVRASAIVGGNFTPLKRAEVSFTSLVLPDGRRMNIETQESLGLPTIYTLPRPAKPKKVSNKPNKQPQSDSGKMAAARQFVRQQAQSQLNAQLNGRTGGLFDFVRGPNKREWVENFLLNKLPYRPQWYRTGTRFDAVLTKTLDFGAAHLAQQDLQSVGTQPAADSVAQMRIVSTISSASARVGDRMEGVLAAPLFTPDRKLELPEGTRVTGKITLAQRARFLHRGGKLRFAIEDLQVPEMASSPDGSHAGPNSAPEPTRAQLAAVEADPGKVKVDQEGTAKATESKTRLLRPAIAAFVAAKSLDNDTGKQTASGTGNPSPNTSGLTLGGFSGFGLLGMAAAKGPPAIGSALGFYGLAWSVYTNIISRGSEVTFQQNAAMAIRFGTPPRKQ